MSARTNVRALRAYLRPTPDRPAPAIYLPSRRGEGGTIALTPALARAAWAGVEAGQVVGRVGDPERCPLATLCRSRGLPAATVGRRTWSPTGSTAPAAQLPLPAWARRFSDLLLKRGGDYGRPVTAAAAIAALDAAWLGLTPEGGLGA